MLLERVQEDGPGAGISAPLEADERRPANLVDVALGRADHEIGPARHAQPPQRLQLGAPHERPGLLLGARDERAARRGVPLLLQTQRGGLAHAGILIVERRAQHGPRVGGRAGVLQIAELARGQIAQDGIVGDRLRGGERLRARFPCAPRAPSATTARARSSNGRSAPSAARRAAIASGRRSGVRLTASGRMRARSAARAAAFSSASRFWAQPRTPPAPPRRAPDARRSRPARSPPASPPARRRRPPAAPPPRRRRRTRRGCAPPAPDPRPRPKREASSADNPATGGTAARPSAVVTSFSSFSLAPVTAAASASTTIGFFGAGAERRQRLDQALTRRAARRQHRLRRRQHRRLTERHHQRQARRAIGRARQIAHQPVRAVGPVGVGEDRQITDRGRPVVLGRRRLAAGRDTGDHHGHAGRDHRLRQRHPVGVAPVRGVAGRVVGELDVEALPGRRPERDLQPVDAVLRVERLQAGAVARQDAQAANGVAGGRRARGQELAAAVATEPLGPRGRRDCRRRARAARSGRARRCRRPAWSTRRRNGSRRSGVRPAWPDRRGARPASRCPAAGAARRSAESARRRSRSARGNSRGGTPSQRSTPAAV